MPKRILQGTVVSDKNDKTVVVKVERRFTHPLFRKTVRTSKKYHAHDADNAHKGRRPRAHPGMPSGLAQQALGRGGRLTPDRLEEGLCRRP